VSVFDVIDYSDIIVLNFIYETKGDFDWFV